MMRRSNGHESPAGPRATGRLAPASGKILFQGQEHIDELDLGWDSFKWRNHQPDIGRFFNVDPLSEKYYYNSPYAFSENKVIAHVELEGLESQSANVAKKYLKDNILEPINSGYNTLKEVVQNAGQSLQFAKDIPKEAPKLTDHIKGLGLNICDTNLPTPMEDNKYVPSPDPNSNSYDVEKSLVDAVLKASKVPQPTNGDFSRAAQNMAKGVDRAVNGEKKAEDMNKNNNQSNEDPKQPVVRDAAPDTIKIEAIIMGRDTIWIK